MKCSFNFWSSSLLPFTPAHTIMSPTTHAASISLCLSAMLLLTLILSSGCHSQTDCEHCSDCLCQPDYLACFNSLDQMDVEGITAHVPSSGHCTNSTGRYNYTHVHIIILFYLWLTLYNFIQMFVTHNVYP